MDISRRAKEVYTGLRDKYEDFTFKMGVKYLNAMDALSDLSEKATLPLLLTTGIITGAGIACKKEEPYVEVMPTGDVIELETITVRKGSGQIVVKNLKDPVTGKANKITLPTDSKWYEVDGSMKLYDTSDYDSARDSEYGKDFLSDLKKEIKVSIIVPSDKFKKYLEEYNWMVDEVRINPENPPYASRKLMTTDVNGDDKIKANENVLYLTSVAGTIENFIFGKELGTTGISEKLDKEFKEYFEKSKDFHAKTGMKKEKEFWDHKGIRRDKYHKPETPHVCKEPKVTGRHYKYHKHETKKPVKRKAETIKTACIEPLVAKEVAKRIGELEKKIEVNVNVDVENRIEREISIDKCKGVRVRKRYQQIELRQYLYQPVRVRFVPSYFPPPVIFSYRPYYFPLPVTMYRRRPLYIPRRFCRR